MQCPEFRRLIGADPHYRAPAHVEHAEHCRTCAHYARRLLQLDALILEALRIDVRSRLDVRLLSRGGCSRRSYRSLKMRRWLGLAASLLMMIGIVTGGWLTSSGDTLASDVVAHIYHEPQSLEADSRTVDATLLRDLLARHDAHLAAYAGAITYARSCLFRGMPIPHLVVQTEAGPVTVLMLPDERVDAPVRVHKDGFYGRILPADKGSIAIVGNAPGVTDAVEQRILKVVQWAL